MGRHRTPGLLVALAVASAVVLFGCGGENDPFVGTWVASEDYSNAGLAIEIVKTDGSYESINTYTGEREPLAAEGDTLVGSRTMVEDATATVVHKSMSQGLLKTRMTVEANGSDLDSASFTYYWIREGSDATAPKPNGLSFPEFQFITRIKAEQKKASRAVHIADSFLAATARGDFSDKQVDRLNEAVDMAARVTDEATKLRIPSSRLDRLAGTWWGTLDDLGAFFNGLVVYFNNLATGKDSQAKFDEFMDQRDEAARGNHETAREIARLLKAYPPE